MCLPTSTVSAFFEKFQYGRAISVETMLKESTAEESAINALCKRHSIVARLYGCNAIGSLKWVLAFLLH